MTKMDNDDIFLITYSNVINFSVVSSMTTTLTPEVKNFIRYGKVPIHIGSDLTNLGVPLNYDKLSPYQQTEEWMKVWNKLLKTQKYNLDNFIQNLDTGVFGPPYLQGLMNVILLNPLTPYQVSIFPKWAESYNKASIERREEMSKNLYDYLEESLGGTTLLDYLHWKYPGSVKVVSQTSGPGSDGGNCVIL